MTLPNLSALPATEAPEPARAPLYIGSRKLRGAGPRYAPYPAGAILIDVTSAQSSTNANREANRIGPRRTELNFFNPNYLCSHTQKREPNQLAPKHQKA